MSGPKSELLCILPWLKLEETIEGPPVWFHPFDAEERPAGMPAALHDRIVKILSSYRQLTGTPVLRATLVSDSLQLTIPEETETVVESLSREIERLTLATVAANRFAERFALVYANSTLFQAFFQRFSLDSEYIGLERRRRDGWALDGGYQHGEIHFSVPPEAAVGATPRPDRGLLKGIRALPLGDPLGGRLNMAIPRFNAANTDHAFVSIGQECVLLAGAFDALLGSPGSKIGVAQNLKSCLDPPEKVLFGSSRRWNSRSPLFDGALDRGSPRGERKNVERMRNEGWSLSSAWMWDFYRVRSLYDHGIGVIAGETLWTPFEHLLAGTHIFPLLVKSMLHAKDAYQWSESDEDALLVLERRLDASDWLRRNGDGECAWGLIGREADRFRLRRYFDDAVTKVFAEMSSVSAVVSPPDNVTAVGPHGEIQQIETTVGGDE